MKQLKCRTLSSWWCAVVIVTAEFGCPFGRRRIISAGTINHASHTNSPTQELVNLQQLNQGQLQRPAKNYSPPYHETFLSRSEVFFCPNSTFSRAVKIWTLEVNGAKVSVFGRTIKAGEKRGGGILEDDVKTMVKLSFATCFQTFQIIFLSCWITATISWLFVNPWV